MSDPTPQPRRHTTGVFPAHAFRVISGANLGDEMDVAEALCAGDTYRLSRHAQMLTLHFEDTDRLTPVVTQDSAIGTAGMPVQPQARLRFMSGNGAEALALLIALDDPDLGGDLCVLPLMGLTIGGDFTLIGIDAPDMDGAVSIPRMDTHALGLARGTRVALADGALVTVEDLAPGDRLLTRDSGAQPVRYIHRRTVNANGAETPIVIPAGRLGNPGAIVLAQHQRLFFYQQGDDRLTEAAEILVRARALVGARGAERRKGGYVEYFVLVMDTHEIVYAEGVPCESVELSARSRDNLPAALAQDIDGQIPGLEHSPHLAQEAQDDDEAIAALSRALMRRSTSDA